MHKDNVEMICSVGELVALFEKSTDLENFLQTVVSIIAYHMKAAVCSVYLLDEQTDELVLRANQGLSADSIGRVRLKIGEGITGLAIKELRAICEGRGSRNPNFKYIPNIQEEHYEAFLAVPIMHALHRVGALVVQDPQPDYFNENDVKALKAIAAQLAVSIENAKLLISLYQQQESAVAPSRQDVAPPQNLLVKGRGASPGIGYGEAVMVDERALENLAGDQAGQAFTLEHFEQALLVAEKQLEHLQGTMESRLMDVASLIFSAQLLMLKDRKFSGAMREQIMSGAHVVESVIRVVNRYIDLFARSSNARLREKIQDVKDLGLRLLRNLPGGEEAGEGLRRSVVVARELLPSDMLKYFAQGVQGLILRGTSGVTAHLSILARSLECPMLIIPEGEHAAIKEGTKLLLDANQGVLLVNPEPDVLAPYQPLLEAGAATPGTVDITPETHTSDGVQVKLMASVNLVSDLLLAKRHLAEGVGLYRSEFPFIIRSNFPSEDEQQPIYRKILKEMEGREVLFRTLDIGGDKMLDYFPHLHESNPFLGLRAIRFSLRYKEVFIQQLRALLRAGAGYDLGIMFPLVASVDDFVQAREVVQECAGQLRAEGIEHNATPRLGVMIELPSIVQVIEELAGEVDFMAIGSNDLIQYLLAVDRTNDQISDLYTAAHPAVLRTIARVVRAANDRNVPLSICGDMAADTRMTEFLVGVGIRRFSIDPHHLPKLQQAVRSLHSERAAAHAQYLLALPTVRQVRQVLEKSEKYATHQLLPDKATGP